MSPLRRFADKELLFIHIPKTGGVSLGNALGFTHLDHRSLRDFGSLLYARQNYFIAAFVRNPWDRCVSAFAYLAAGGLNETDAQDSQHYLARYAGDFEAFVKDAFNDLNPEIFQQKHFRPQSDYVCDFRGQPVLDFVGRFENLQADYEKLCGQLGILPVQLPHMNASKHQNYQQYYTPLTQDIIEKAYQQDIENFAYDFEQG